jgi:hypothetical protein
VGSGSFDALAGAINAMFDFDHPDARPYLLDKSTGQVLKQWPEASPGRISRTRQ